MLAGAEELDTKTKAVEKRLEVVSWKLEELTSVGTACGEALSAPRMLNSLQQIKQEFSSLQASLSEAEEVYY